MAAEYPLPKFHFQVEWGGTKIGFTEVTGLDAETNVIEYRDGDSPEFTNIKQAGLRKFSNITLKRGTFEGDNEFYVWWEEVRITDSAERRDITISLLNQDHGPVVVWTAKNAWPCKIVTTDLKSDANEVAIESIELAHEGLTIENG